MRSFKINGLGSFFKKISKYFFELLVVIFGVYLGFMANNYSEELKQRDYINATIKEMYVSLEHDIEDAVLNKSGHETGLKSVKYFGKVYRGEEVEIDSFEHHLLKLTRSYVSIQNTASFETLKSKGLNLITNDTLRSKIIKLFDFQFDMLEKVEEKYAESQLFANFYPDLMEILDQSLYFGNTGQLEKIAVPLDITNAEKSRLVLILKRLMYTRYFNISVYDDVIGDMKDLRISLENEYPFLKEK
ncbi:MAG: hypothetical protein KA536_20650 [Saprospiraceae bacterium]|nr:hypothetical protein [Saprospiraceae bacterium]